MTQVCLRLLGHLSSITFKHFHRSYIGDLSLCHHIFLMLQVRYLKHQEILWGKRCICLKLFYSNSASIPIGNISLCTSEFQEGSQIYLSPSQVWLHEQSPFSQDGWYLIKESGSLVLFFTQWMALANLFCLVLI